MDGKVVELEAPCSFVSKPGVRKAFYVLDELHFSTIHPTKETDLDKLEKKLVRKSRAWLTANEQKLIKEGG